MGPVGFSKEQLSNIRRELPRQFTARIRCDNSLLRNNLRKLFYSSCYSGKCLRYTNLETDSGASVITTSLNSLCKNLCNRGVRVAIDDQYIQNMSTGVVTSKSFANLLHHLLLKGD